MPAVLLPFVFAPPLQSTEDGIDWRMVSAIGEIVGAVAVVFSLIYLGRQIGLQNRESRIQSVNELTRQWNDFLGVLTEHRDLCETWLKGMSDFHALDPPRLVQFSACIGRLFRIYESLWQHNQEKRFTEDMWSGVERAMYDAMTYPGVRAWWPTRAHWYHTAFIEHIEERFDQIEHAPNVYGEQEMREAEDPRLHGQRSFLQAATLELQAYCPPANHPDRDHAHCAFCWTQVGPAGDAVGASQEAYTTVDRWHWVCPACFEDFHETFAWKSPSLAAEG